MTQVIRRREQRLVPPIPPLVAAGRIVARRISNRGASMDSTQSLARRAGLQYVLASSLAPFAYLYVPNRLIVGGDVLATADRVTASEGLLRAAIVAELSGATLLVFAALGSLMLERIDAIQNGALLLASLVVIVGLVLRWKQIERTTAGAAV